MKQAKAYEGENAYDQQAHDQNPRPRPHHRRRHELAVLAEQGAVRPEDRRRAVERPALPLDHADHEMDAVVPGDGADPIGRRSRHLDGALEVAAELVPTLWRADAEGDAEVVALGVAADERFGEDDEFRPLLGGVGGEFGEFLERPGGVEQDRGRLNHGDTHRPRWDRGTTDLVVSHDLPPAHQFIRSSPGSTTGSPWPSPSQRRSFLDNERQVVPHMPHVLENRLR